MKNHDKELTDKIKDKMKDFDAANPLPKNLSRATITETLKQQTGKQKKRAKVVQMKRLTSLAAAFVILVGAVTAFNLYKPSTGPVAGIESAKSEKQIVELFNQMSKQAAKDQKRFIRRGFYRSKDAAVEQIVGDAAPNAQNEGDRESTGQGAHGETNVQVKGIDEPDVMKNDGKHLYTVTNGAEVNIYTLLPADAMKRASTIKFTNSTDQSEYVNSLFVKGDLLVVFSEVHNYTATEQATEGQSETQSGKGESAPIPEESDLDIADPVDDGKQSSGDNPVGNDSQDASPGGNNDDNVISGDDAQESPGYEGPDMPIDGIEPAPYYYRGYSNGRSTSVCTVYDITNRQAPKQIKRITQDGSFISARLIGSELYVLSSFDVNIYALKDYGQKEVEELCIPSVAVDGDSQHIPVGDISITTKPEPGYLVVCGIRLDDLTAEPDKKAVLGGGAQAYCTADSLFAARTVYADGGPVRSWVRDVAIVGSSNPSSTEIYRFAIGGGKVEYQYAGKVAGVILNQFSMDEYKGYFRIATTQGDWNNTSSNVFVLNDKLEVVGKIENIAPGERIFAVRFMGDAGYVVTFEQTDPLFVLNLSDPKAPKITGELKIPGFSTYLHSVTETLLLGIGQNGNDSGTIPGIKLSLFDVSDPANPKEVDKLIIEGNCSTEAMNNHKAFMVYPEKTIFGIPVLRYNDIVTYDDGNSSSSSSGTVSSYVGSDYAVSSFETFTVEGGKIVPVMSYKEKIQPSANSSYYYDGISRGTYVDNTIYTISGRAISSFDLASGKMLGTLKMTPPAYFEVD